MSKPWHKKALELFIKGFSGRKIAKEVGMSKTQVNDYLRKFKDNPELIQEVNTKENFPKILLFDIETSMILAYVWSLWKQNVPLNAIVEDWYVICWSAQWLHEDEIIHSSIHHFDPLEEVGRYKNNERYVVEALWLLLDEADVVVAYNGKSFDKKKMNSKFLEYNLPEPTPYKIIDPMLICKGNFALTSNKMDYVAKYVSDVEQGKLSTNLQLWIDCMNDNEEQLDNMQKYCDEDINVLRRVYLAVRHWDKNSPNLALHYDDNKPRCNGCGSDDLVKLENKTSNTNLSKFGIVRCNNCSKILRDRTNQLSKDKRKSLYMNVR